MACARLIRLKLSSASSRASSSPPECRSGCQRSAARLKAARTSSFVASRALARVDYEAVPESAVAGGAAEEELERPRVARERRVEIDERFGVGAAADARLRAVAEEGGREHRSAVGLERGRILGLRLVEIPSSVLSVAALLGAERDAQPAQRARDGRRVGVGGERALERRRRLVGAAACAQQQRAEQLPAQSLTCPQTVASKRNVPPHLGP